MNGLGNDFLIIDDRIGQFAQEQLPELAKKLCHRQFSIGADGLMVVQAAQNGGDFRMSFVNNDGSFSEMCGNGARCLCRYGYEHGLSGEHQRIETVAGLVEGWRVDKRNYRIALNRPTNTRLHMSLLANGVGCRCSYTELGDPGIPHVAMELPSLSFDRLAKLRPLASALRHHPEFPRGANVNFYRIVDAEHIEIATFERGVEDFTLACGTGVSATVALLTLANRVSGKQITVQVPGGRMIVDAAKDGALYLSGSTTLVCTGETYDEENELYG